jgi:tryptophan halogenase
VPLLGLDLHRILRAVESLVDFLPYGVGESHLRRAFNARMAELDAGLRDATALHYRLGRRPEPFWTRARDDASADTLPDRLDLYEMAGRIEAPPGTGFDETAYYHTLAGADLLPRRAYAPADLVDARESARFLAAVQARTEALAAAFEPHARALERIHGDALPASPAIAASLRPSAPARDPLASLRHSEHGARLVDAVLALGQPFGHEHSVKASAGVLQTDRYLLSLHRTALGFDPGHTLDRLASGLGLAAGTRAEAAAAIPGADILHLGFEDGPSGPLYKLYVEWSAEADRVWREGAPAEGGTPILVHRAYKWRPLDAAPPVVTLYHWPRVRTPDEIAARLACLGEAAGGAFTRRLADAILDVVRRQGTGLPHYLEAAEEPGPRLSYDLNLYAARLKLGAVAPILRDAFVAIGVPVGEAERMLAARQEEDLGHVASGLGRDGRPFVTVYSGVRAA